uniref:Uncharacterized protein n=1 Tax=Bionectria ochroleuca TaxID=29856 RepID=A0A0B7KGK9_BIOOC
MQENPPDTPKQAHPPPNRRRDKPQLACDLCRRRKLGRPPASCTYPAPEPGPPYVTSSNDLLVSMEVNAEDSYRQSPTSKGPTTSAHTEYPTIVSQGFLQLIGGRDINFTTLGQESEVVNVQEKTLKDPSLKAYYSIHDFPI